MQDLTGASDSFTIERRIAINDDELISNDLRLFNHDAIICEAEPRRIQTSQRSPLTLYRGHH